MNPDDLLKDKNEQTKVLFSLEGCDWLERFDAALRNGKHVLFYGNTNDLFLPLGFSKPRRLKEVLLEYFRNLPVDADEKTFENKYRHMFSYNMSKDVSPADIVKTEEFSESPKFEQPRNLLEAADCFYKFLTGSESCVVFVNFFDMLFEAEDRQNIDERKALIKLRNAFIQAKVWDSMNERRSVFIGACSDLGKAPTWLYRDNPTLALIHIPTPNVVIRSRFFKLRMKPTFVEIYDNKNDDERAKEDEEYETSFISLTDGLSLSDLEAFRVGCLGLRQGIDSPRRLRELISAYRYGKQNNPWEQFSEYNQGQLQEAKAIIKKSVKGQDQAVEAVVDMLISAAVGITMSPAKPMGGKPKGAFFFVGPTGVGKTEMAKALANFVFQDESRLKRFDMSEFRQEHSAERLTGAPPGYRGYEEGGQLTNYVKEHPFCILLFDEIEKAHPSLLDKFLQILEDGRLTDGKGETVNFSQTVIIFTSNLGASHASRNPGLFTNDVLDLLSDSGVNWGDRDDPVWNEAINLADRRAKEFRSITDDEPTYEQVSQFFKLAVRDYFVNKIQRLEILNRFGNNVLAFDFLRPSSVEAICLKFLEILVDSAWRKRKLKLRIDRSIVDLVRKEMGIQTNIAKGGRHIRTLLEKHVEQPLTRWAFSRLKNETLDQIFILSNKTGGFEGFQVIPMRSEEGSVSTTELVETGVPWNKNA